MDAPQGGRFVFILVFVFLLLLIVTTTSGKAAEITELGLTEIVSIASDDVTKGNYDSHQTAISADGQQIAFWSWSDNLVDNDENRYCSTFTPPSCPDIFVRDRSSGKTVRVSVASDGTEAEHWSQNPSISQEGRFVAFNSYANNLVDNDTNICSLVYGTTNCSDVFVHDRDVDGDGIFDEPGQIRTIRVSVASDGTQGNNHSTRPSISADGRFVAFSSNATNLDPNDNPNVSDVFLHDRDSDENGIFDETDGISTKLISVTFNGEDLNGGAAATDISADGRFVVFESDANNFVAGDNNNSSDVFVFNADTNDIERVSEAPGHVEANDDSFQGSISNDGRYVAFVSRATNLTAAPTGNTFEVYVHDRQTGDTDIVSLAYSGEYANASSSTPVINDDGTYVIFTSSATDIIENGTGGQVFIYNLQTQETSIVSVSNNGEQGNEASYDPSVSPDGRHIAFQTSSNNLSDIEDTNSRDIFVHDRVVGPFLELPISYPDGLFSRVLMGNIGKQGPGRVNAWRDNDGVCGNNEMARWDGLFLASTGTDTGQGINWYDCHTGTDFSRNYDKEQVYPAATGTVVSLNTGCVPGPGCTDFGNFIKIDHHNCFQTIYGHLDQVNVALNQNIIDITQPIGTIGSTGKSTGPHLHFEVRYDENCFNNSLDANYIVVDPHGWQGYVDNPSGALSDYLWVHPMSDRKLVLSTISTTLQTPSGDVLVEIPSFAVFDNMALELWNAPSIAQENDGLRSTGNTFWLRDIQFPTLAFAENINIQVNYSQTAVAHFDESQLSIYWRNLVTDQWEELPTNVDPLSNTAMVQTDKGGRFDLQAPLLIAADILEPNDDPYIASPINDNSSSLFNLFDIASDEDWFVLNTTAGETYTFNLLDLGPSVNLDVELYDSNFNLVTINNNRPIVTDLSFEWTAEESSMLFIRVFQSTNSSYGENATYTIQITGDINLSYLPMIQVEK